MTVWLPVNTDLLIQAYICKINGQSQPCYSSMLQAKTVFTSCVSRGTLIPLAIVQMQQLFTDMTYFFSTKCSKNGTIQLHNGRWFSLLFWKIGAERVMTLRRWKEVAHLTLFLLWVGSEQCLLKITLEFTQKTISLHGWKKYV